MPVQVPIVGPSYDSGIPGQDQQKCINMYIETDQVGGKSPLFLKSTPGLSSFGTISGRYSVRTGFKHRDLVYIVVDHQLYTINSAGTSTLIGGLATSSPLTSEPVRFDAYDDQIGIVDEGRLFCYTITTNTLVEVTLPSELTTIVDIAVHDGYWILVKGASATFYISANRDLTSIDGGDFAQVGDKKDILKAVISDHGQVWFFGEKMVNVWVRVLDPLFPFEEQNGAQLAKGIVSKHTLCRSDNTLYWLGRDEEGGNLVVRANGFAAQAATDAAIAREIQSYTTISDAIAYTHRIGMNQFYVLTFPTENKTWVLDLKTGMWHERDSYINGEFGRHRGNCQFEAFGKSLVGDYCSATVFYYDEDTYTEDSNMIRRLRRTSVLPFNNYFTSIFDFSIDLQRAVGTSTGQGVDPQIMLRVSVDGGHVWSNWSYRSMGKLGEYHIRPIWDTLGYGRDWVIEIQITDPVKVVILGASAFVDNNKAYSEQQMKKLARLQNG